MKEEEYKEEFSNRISSNLFDRTYYIANDCKDVWDWSEKVYAYVEGLGQL